MKINITGDCYVVGDIHGDAPVLADVLSIYDIKNCTLILLGDIGIWRYRDYKRYMILDEAAKERNIIIYALRGNHDNPAFFSLDDSSPILKRFWDKFTNFKPLPDFTILNVNNNNGIAIGGGLSIDRCLRRSYIRKRGRIAKFYSNDDWWVGEAIKDASDITEKVDFILSHVGPRPTKVGPLNENTCSFFKLDPDLGEAIKKEECQIDKLYEQFHPKKWWFGHFHINDAFDYKDSRCYAVDILNLSPLYL